ncbi:MAG: ATP-binding protein, partial [Myxococcales bacterium]
LDFLPRAGVNFPPLGAVTGTLYMFFLAQTLQRLRLLDLHELLGKVAALSVMAIILGTIYGPLVYWVGNRPGLFLFNTLLASFVILILFEPLREKVEEWVVATLFRERFEMIRTLQAMKSKMANVIEVPALAKLVLDTFHETRRVTHASIYLLSDHRPGFFLLDHRGPSPVTFLDAAAARHLVSAAMRGEKAVLVENLERRIAELRTAEQTEHRRTREEVKRLNDLKATLAQMKAGIVVPLLAGDRVIGFLTLWDERVPEAYASDEIALVLEIAEFVGTVVENSKLFDKMKEKDRLAALGEMAAGLAHEIRNPLGAIKGAAQFLDPKSLPGEDGEFLGVIVEEVNRLNSVVTQFLDYSRPLKQNFAPTDLSDVITRTMKLLQSESIPENVAVKLELPERPPRTQGDAEQLKQVLINLILNAVQAMPDGGSLTLSVKVPETFPQWRLAESQEFLELRVRDTGLGMSEEARRNIFVPFYTTKEKGTGLGLAISQRIVKNHGGSISVWSKVGEGTEFLIRLPAIAEPKQPELAEGTPSPDLTPYPGTVEPPPEVQAKKEARREKKKRKVAG